MTRAELNQRIEEKKSFLCVGLDPDLNKIPKHLLELEDPIFEFNKAIIDATHDLAVAYKPNTAFYEAYGLKGWQSLEKTIAYINEHYSDLFTIADAKRGDIGNTSAMYAKAFLETLNFDSITVAPYMGEDSVVPFLGLKNKWVILLALTSNSGSSNFQVLENTQSKKLFEEVLEQSKEWATDDEMMYVVGATKAKALSEVRTIVPNHFLLVPGVGAQGGSLEEVYKYGKAQDGIGLLVNSSRGIIYSSSKEDFASSARKSALELQSAMMQLLD